MPDNFVTILSKDNLTYAFLRRYFSGAKFRAGVIIARETDAAIEILFVRERDRYNIYSGENEIGLFGPPKGSSKYEDASPMHTAARELYEELKISVCVTELKNKIVIARPEIGEIVFIYILFMDGPIEVDLNTEELSEYRWGKIDEFVALGEQCSQLTRTLVQTLLNIPPFTE